MDFSRITIPTERLLLRPFGTGDAEAVFHLNNDPEVLKFTNNWKPFVDTDAAGKWIGTVQKEQYEKHGYGRLAVILKETGELIGWSGIKFSEEAQASTLGYRFVKKYWGKGFATEAAQASIAFGLHMIGLDTIVAYVLPENPDSAKVAEKAGLVFSGRADYGSRSWNRFHVGRTPDRSHGEQPLFSSAGLSFYEILPADAEIMYALNLDPLVVQYTGDDPFESIGAAREFLSMLQQKSKPEGTGRLKLVDNKTGECIGWCGLKFHEDTGETDVGYRLFRRHWGKGYGTEACSSAMKFGFGRLGLKRIYAEARKENIASLRIMEKCGMQFLRESKGCDGDTHIYEKFAE